MYTLPERPFPGKPEVRPTR